MNPELPSMKLCQIFILLLTLFIALNVSGQEQKMVSDLGLWFETMVPAGLFVAFAVLIFWLINKPTIADFMVSAEGEMKKVSWSSRKEIAVSTFIVIVVMVFMAILLGITDYGFQLFFMWLLR